jgi:hypothetical protein
VINDMSDDFDDLFNRCLADITTGRETIDSCLKRNPAQAGWLAALLELAARIQAAPAITLPDDKRRALEARMLKRAAQLRSKPTSRPVAPRHPLWRRNIALALASVIAFILLLGSAVGASAASVPGDFLYPVKRATEQVRLAVTPAEQQVELHLEFARQRLQELTVLQERGEVSADLLAEISSETELVLERAPSLPQEKEHGVLLSLTDLQDQQLAVLAVMASSTQGEEQTKVRNAQADSASKRQKAKVLLAGAAPDPEPEPTAVHGTPPQGDPMLKPTPADGLGPHATPKPTKAPPATTPEPKPKAERTPPGQFAPEELRPTKEHKR